MTMNHLNRQPNPAILDFVEVRSLDEEGIEGGIWKEKTRIGITSSGERWLIKINTNEENDEVVAYQLSQNFFDGVVPETHLIILDSGEEASAQRMVTGKSAHDYDLAGELHNIVRESNILRDLANMVVMDFMIGNPDRHGNNWFIMDNGRIAAIDNGFASDEMDMPLKKALRPAFKCLLADDCSRTPALIAIMRSITGRIDQREQEAVGICDKYSTSHRHALAGRWQRRVEILKRGIQQWERELEEHCNA